MEESDSTKERAIKAWPGRCDESFAARARLDEAATGARLLKLPASELA
jgi:hypothetical protein